MASRRMGGLTVLLAVGLTLFFYSTASKSSASSDPFANILTAWTMARHGSPVLQDHSQLIEPEAFFRLTWVVEGKDGPVSLFPPGAALLAVPLYTLAESELNLGLAVDATGASFSYGVPRIEPSVLVAAASTAIAAALLFLTLGRLGNSGEAMAGALIFATATGAWSVASQALWQHGTAMMWLAIALWSYGSRARELAWIQNNRDCWSRITSDPLQSPPLCRGNLFFGYRYPMEGLLAASPLLFLSYHQRVKPHRSRVVLFAVGVIAAFGLQAV